MVNQRSTSVIRNRRDIIELHGAAASGGRVTGPARILHRLEEGTSLRRGDILVCLIATRAWTPLIAGAAGVVVETGSALSNPASIAREYGVPVVVAVKDAMSRIRDGQIVTIDGAAGTSAWGPAKGTRLRGRGFGPPRRAG